ncbi:MAG: hypothetical protein O2904_02900 [bacterium]|nr:hypothetical protein [bacterium]
MKHNKHTEAEKRLLFMSLSGGDVPYEGREKTTVYVFRNTK